MRAFVLTDTTLTSRAGQFVWLAINTEDDANAGFLQRFPIDALPTFLVLDPVQEKVVMRYVGGMTVPQTHALLDAVRAGLATGDGGAERADAALARADRLYGERRNAEAVVAYREALDAAPSIWSPYPRVIESLLFSYGKTGETAPMLALAQQALPRVAGTPAALSVAASGLDTALGLPPTASDRRPLIARFEAAVRAAIADPAIVVAADDRSGAYQTLVEARKDADDAAGAHATAEAWAGFLETEAARAKRPEERAVFDAHRLSAYLELKQPERALPPLEASERDFPDDYNPPARLAVAYQAMKQWEPAKRASDRALARAYGPRKLRVYQVRAEIFAGMGDKAAVRRTLEEALAHAEGLPPGQRSEAAIAAVRKRLASLDAPPKAP